MSGGSLILLLLALQIKHLVLDWIWQPPWMWQNKGTFGHPGGIVHSAGHALATFALFWWFTRTFDAAVWVMAAEFVVHYAIDWTKMNINARRGWKCTTHHAFWCLTGVDQFLHQVTYLVIAYVAWDISYG